MLPRVPLLVAEQAFLGRKGEGSGAHVVLIHVAVANGVEMTIRLQILQVEIKVATSQHRQWDQGHGAIVCYPLFDGQSVPRQALGGGFMTRGR